MVDHLVESNLFGHDSHGAIRYYEYTRAIREGRFQPRATPTIVRDYPSTAVVDAGGALGQVGATFAMNLAIDKARQHGLATVTLRNTSHVGPRRCLSTDGGASRELDRPGVRKRRTSWLSDCPIWRAGGPYQHQPDCIFRAPPRNRPDSWST